MIKKINNLLILVGLEMNKDKSATNLIFCEQYTKKQNLAKDVSIL